MFRFCAVKAPGTGKLEAVLRGKDDMKDVDIERRRALAPLFMILSALSFAMMGAAVKYAQDISFIQKVFFRNFVMTLFIVPVLVRQLRSRGMSVLTGNRGTRGLLLLRSLFGLGGVALFFFSIEHLMLADAAMLNRLSAFFVMVLAALFLGERIRRYQVPALLAAFTGALLIIKPGFRLEFLPALAGISASVLAAGAYTIIARLKGREEPFTIMFWFSGISTLAAFLPMLLVWRTPSSATAAALLLTGLFAACGQYFLTMAYTHGPAGEVSIYNYTNIVFSAVIGFFIWHEVPDLFSFLGAILIIGAAVGLRAVSRRRG